MPQVIKGSLFAAAAATLWGLTGLAAQFMYAVSDINPLWLSYVRMLMSGAMLLTAAYIKYKKQIFAVFKDKHDLKLFLIYCFGGNFFVQYSYLKAIECSDAATATMLQFVSPVMVLIICAVISRKIPSLLSFLFAAVSITGIALISTKGDLSCLAISKQALLWGMVSALSLCITTVAPGDISKKYGAETIIGLAMLIGGIVFGFVFSPLKESVHVTPPMWLLIVATAIVGTSLAFIFYFKGITLAGATTAGVIGTLEVAVSVVFSAIIFKSSFTIFDIVGMALIIFSASALTINSSKESIRAKSTKSNQTF